MMRPQAEGHQGLRQHQRLQRGMDPADTLASDFGRPELRENKSPLFQAPPACGRLLQQPREPHTALLLQATAGGGGGQDFS